MVPNPTDVLDRTLADLVAEAPARSRILERAGIDYCCGGRRPLADAAREAGLDLHELASELAGVATPAGAVPERFGPVALVDHLVATHHAYLHEELPALEALAARVRDAHVARHPELAVVAALVHAIRADLEPHLAKEERVLFPAIVRLAGGERDLPFGSIEHPIAVMLREHDQAGDLLRRLRATTQDYAVPPDGCPSYRALYGRLAELESDTHRHIHLENNVLFPAVVDLGSGAGSDGS